MTIGAAFLGAVLSVTSINAEISAVKTDKVTDESKSNHVYFTEKTGKQNEAKQNYTHPQANIANVFIGAALCVGSLVATRKTSQKIRELEGKSTGNANKPPPSL